MLSSTHAVRRFAGAAFVVAATLPNPATAQTESPDLNVVMYVHDDVVDSDERLLSSRLRPWATQMETAILPDRKVNIYFRRRVPGITDVRYDYPGSVQDWDKVMQGHIDAKLPQTEEGVRNTRSLLLVRHRIAPGVLGEATLRTAIASLAGTPSVVGHELGHLLGARHNLVAKREVGFLRVCATYMHEVDGKYFSCGDYSVGNTLLIRRKMHYRANTR